jgi:hypothetical protein
MDCRGRSLEIESGIRALGRGEVRVIYADGNVLR